jgi:hypothetical protein
MSARVHLTFIALILAGWSFEFSHPADACHHHCTYVRTYIRDVQMYVLYVCSSRDYCNRGCQPLVAIAAFGTRLYSTLIIIVSCPFPFLVRSPNSNVLAVLYSFLVRVVVSTYAHTISFGCFDSIRSTVF